MTSKAILALGILLSSTQAARSQTNINVSLDSSNGQGNGATLEGVTSNDGRYTAFASSATNYFLPDANGARDIFRRDRVAQQTVLVSISTGGTIGSGDSYAPSITPNGRYVLFISSAPDLVAGDTNGTFDVFVRDMFLSTTELVSKNTAGVPGNGFPYAAEISNDGRYVAFSSDAINLVPLDTNGFADVFVRDRTLGTTIRVSVSTAGNQGNGLCALAKRDVQISGDGRYVSFTSNASNLVIPDTNGGTVEIFLRDLQLGTTTIASLSATGTQGNSWSGHHALSFDGRYIAFTSAASNLVTYDSMGTDDVFVRDLVLGKTAMVSMSSTGDVSNGYSDEPSISQNGRYVAFKSGATNLTPLVTGNFNVYVRDRVTGLTTLESPDFTGNQTNASCVNASISGNGRFVAFESSATDLIASDTNGVADVFLRDRGPLPSYTSYCFGDGSAAACPCANESVYGQQQGCKYSVGHGGKLTATGFSDVNTDTFVLRGSQMGGSSCQYFQGETAASFPFGDGLLCAFGTLIRLGVKINVNGESRYPDTGDLPISVMGGVTGGESRTYQIWFRDSPVFCTPATHNMTNAIEVNWTPCPGC